MPTLIRTEGDYMFLPARMKRISVLVLDSYQYALVNELHELGVVELKAFEDEKSNVTRAKIDESIKDITPLLIHTGSILEIFKKTKVPDTGFKIPKPPLKEKVKAIPLKKLISYSHDILSKIEAPTRQIDVQLREVDVKTGKLSSALLLLDKIKDINLDLSYIGESTRVFTKIGEIPTDSVSELEKKLKCVLLASQDELKSIVLVVGFIEEKERVYRTLKEINFQEISLPKLKGTPKEAIEKFQANIKSLAKTKDELLKKLSEISSEFERRLLVLKELLEIERERAEASAVFGRTERTYLVQGYVPEKNVIHVVERLKNKTSNHVYISIDEPVNTEENIPILLENPKPIKSFELLTEMFALPNYNELDPTPLLAPAFLLFFGLMLTDAVYGIIVAAVGIGIIRTLGRVSPSAKDLGIILTAGGISAFIWGILLGSYCGDFFTSSSDGKVSIGTALTGITIPPLWLDPYQKELKYGLSPIVVILLMAIAIGFIHINFGNLLGLRKSIKRKDLKDSLGHLWSIVFQSGLILLVLKYPVGAKILLILALGMLFYSSGPMGFFGITGLLGDSLSYTRLLALALATGGIAIAINILVKLVSGFPFVGTIIAITVFFVGHIFNTVMNTLGAFIHSLRLHYVEFFGKFYEGGGNKFKPFKVERTYTEIEGDTIG